VEEKKRSFNSCVHESFLMYPFLNHPIKVKHKLQTGCLRLGLILPFNLRLPISSLDISHPECFHVFIVPSLIYKRKNIFTFETCRDSIAVYLGYALVCDYSDHIRAVVKDACAVVLSSQGCSQAQRCQFPREII
jgi:hypothetical protein